MKFILITASFLTLYSHGLLAEDHAQVTVAQGEDWRFRKGSLSMALRSNAAHFWSWARSVSQEMPSNLTEPQGLVVGDGHQENFSFAHQKDREPILVPNDIDDMAVAPFYFDFIKYLTVTYALTKRAEQFNAQKYLASYVQGVRSASQQVKAPSLPFLLKEDYSATLQDIEKKYQQRIDKIIYDKSHTFKASAEVTPWKELSQAQQREFNELEKYFARALPIDAKVLDRATAAKESGGSQNVPRFLFLLKPRDGKNLLLIEFKEMLNPSAALYNGTLQSWQKNFSLIEKYFWQNWSFQNNELIEAGRRSFWMRPKTPNFINISANDITEPQLLELSNYQLFHLGYWHGVQLTQANRSMYLKALESSSARTQSVVEDYVKYAKKNQK